MNFWAVHACFICLWDAYFSALASILYARLSYSDLYFCLFLALADRKGAEASGEHAGGSEIRDTSRWSCCRVYWHNHVLLFWMKYSQPSLIFSLCIAGLLISLLYCSDVSALWKSLQMSLTHGNRWTCCLLSGTSYGCAGHSQENIENRFRARPAALSFCR